MPKARIGCRYSEPLDSHFQLHAPEPIAWDSDDSTASQDQLDLFSFLDFGADFV
jgi:hypothetical protein